MIIAFLILWAIAGSEFALAFLLVAFVGNVITSILSIWAIPANYAHQTLVDRRILSGTATVGDKFSKAFIGFLVQLVLTPLWLLVIYFIIAAIIAALQ